jgi:hypothetical protein
MLACWGGEPAGEILREAKDHNQPQEQLPHFCQKKAEMGHPQTI